MSFCVIAPTPWWITFSRTSECSNFEKLGDDSLDGADDVALDDEVQVGDLAGLHLLEKVLQRHAARALRRQLLATEPLGAPRRQLAREPVVLDDASELACGRRLVEAEDLHRLAGERLLNLLALVVEERLYAAVRVSGHDRVADDQRPAVDEHRRHRAAADVEARLDDRAGRLGVRVRLRIELEVGDEQDLLEQRVETHLGLRRHLCELRRPAPVLRLQPFLGELGLDAVDVRVGQVDLVDRDDDRHVRGAGVRDGLLRLRHDAVVGCDDEHRDVRHLRAAGAHGGERFVARRVEERDLPAVDVDLVGADVLRDAACLGRDDLRVADRVEQRRLAVVDVAHDRDDRRTRDERLFGIVVRLRLVALLVGRVLDLHLALELGADQLHFLVGERLRRRAHLAEGHENLDQLRHWDAERLREVADGDAGLDGDGTRSAGPEASCAARAVALRRPRD